MRAVVVYNRTNLRKKGTAMRITETRLEAAVNHLNRLTGSPLKYAGDKVFNIGHYHIDKNAGGYALYRVTNEAGACADILQFRGTKSELYYRINAFCEGFVAGQKSKN